MAKTKRILFFAFALAVAVGSPLFGCDAFVCLGSGEYMTCDPLYGPDARYYPQYQDCGVMHDNGFGYWCDYRTPCYGV